MSISLLGGNRVAPARLYFNLLATFVIGGLWHGAGWTFVLWGTLHGIALCLNRFWQSMGLRLPGLLGWLMTFLFVHVAWIFFRAADVPSALGVFRGMFGYNGMGSRPAGGQSLEVIVQSWSQLAGFGNLAFLVVFALVAFLARNSVELADQRSAFKLRHALLAASAFIACVLLGISSKTPEFLYFNF